MARKSVGIVAGLHVIAIALLLGGHVVTQLTLGFVLFAYTRGLLHALDADHLCMIDGSTRKLLGEHRDARGVGLAFSLGHSTVVLVAGLAVVVGAAWVREAIAPDTNLALMLSSIGASVSALYLLGVAASNTPLLVAAVRGRHTGPHSAPRGWWARLLAAPLAKVTHRGHVYLFGVLFGLGFDTASTIALLMLTASGSLAGVPPVALLGFPFAFAAAMTLGDSINASIMLRVYTEAASDVRRRRLNIALLAVSIASAIAVGAVTISSLAAEWTGVQVVPEIDTTFWGYALALLAASGALCLLLGRRRARRPEDAVVAEQRAKA